MSIHFLQKPEMEEKCLLFDYMWMIRFTLEMIM